MVKFDQTWFIFQHCLPCGPNTFSICVAALGFLWFRSSHPDPQKSPETADMTLSSVQYCFSSQVFFSCWETENNQMVPNQENMEGGQPVQSHNHCKISNCNHRLVCSKHWSWWNRTPFVFRAIHKMSLDSITFQSPELLIQCQVMKKKKKRRKKINWK